jgi:hypothetical protein
MPIAAGIGGPALLVDETGAVIGGAADEAAVTDPDAAAATITGLLRGILTQQNAMLAILVDVYDASGHTIKTS